MGILAKMLLVNMSVKDHEQAYEQAMQTYKRLIEELRTVGDTCPIAKEASEWWRDWLLTADWPTYIHN